MRSFRRIQTWIFDLKRDFAFLSVKPYPDFWYSEILLQKWIRSIWNSKTLNPGQWISDLCCPFSMGLKLIWWRCFPSGANTGEASLVPLFDKLIQCLALYKWTLGWLCASLGVYGWNNPYFNYFTQVCSKTHLTTLNLCWVCCETSQEISCLYLTNGRMWKAHSPRLEIFQYN